MGQIQCGSIDMESFPEVCIHHSNEESDLIRINRYHNVETMGAGP